MAKKVYLKYKDNDNVVKEGYVGFSWTVFFFGFIVPLYRGDYKTGILMLVFWLTIGAFLYAVGGGFIINIVIAFWYNKYYTQKLIDRGFVPLAKIDEEILIKNGIYF